MHSVDVETTVGADLIACTTDTGCLDADRRRISDGGRFPGVRSYSKLQSQSPKVRFAQRLAKVSTHLLALPAPVRRSAK